MVTIILDNSVRFKTDFLEQKNSKLLDKLIDRFTYDNPKYLENEKWGYDNRNEKRYLYSYKYDSKNKVISIEKINNYVYDLKTEYTYYNHRKERRFTVNSTVRFLFDDKGKIVETYDIK